MAFSQSDILRYSQTRILSENASLAKVLGRPTAFLSHSHKDAELAKGLQGFLQAQGWNVYIDWEDLSMPDRPNSETAQKIQNKILELDWFLYLATANSATSRWCPWEIGYADGVKSKTQIAIVPTYDSRGVEFGGEYLQLYHRIDFAQSGGVGVFGSNNRGMKLTG